MDATQISLAGNFTMQQAVTLLFKHVVQKQHCLAGVVEILGCWVSIVFRFANTW